ncbi:MAG: hypothetical protein JRF72_03770 [Deltaproteobacteria bacterium]|jgi:hypothetical protein|nr:hypothetical protein [Deltaproteobacteria bacterium]
METVSIHLYGKLRRFAEQSGAGHGNVLKVEPQPGETLEQLLIRVGIPFDKIYNIFFNARLLATRSAMAHWIRYRQVHENPLEWKLGIAVKAGDRIGLFGSDMAALVI